MKHTGIAARPSEHPPPRAGLPLFFESCIYGDLLGRFDLYWEAPVLIKWPIPTCLSCPFRNPCLTCDNDFILPYDEVYYTLEGLPEGFEVRVVGKNGDILTEALAAGGRIDLVFETTALEEMSIEVQSNGDGGGQLLGLTSQLFVNGQEQALP